MPSFTYQAVDAKGQSSTGVLAADSRSAVVEMITAQGLYPVSVQAQGEAAPAAKHHRRVSAAKVEAFTRELANLLAAGVPLSKALHVLCRESSNPAARELWKAIYDDVTGGMSLADALARWPKSFSTVYVAMVRAGETGGFLDLVLSQIADFRQRETELKGRVKAAMVYPAMLAVLAVGVLVVLLTFFIPRFSGIFEDFGASLPALTQAIMWASKLVTRYGILLAAGLVVLLVVLRRAMSTDAGRRMLERLWLRVPGVGTVLARFALVRFSRMLGTLLGAGVTLVTALRVAKEAIGNQTLSDAVEAAIDEVKRGTALSHSLSHTPQLFPAAVVEMLAVAEESGRLDKELLRLGQAYEIDLDRRLRMLVALVEPAMLFIMAALIGTVVIGMLLPIFTLQDLIK